MSGKIKFRALLLAAGFGSRLMPLTKNKPKCLMEINGIPLLEYWLINLEKTGCESVLINTHYLSEQIDSYLKKRQKSSMIIETSFEKNLLGTGGTLKKNLSYFKNEIGLLIHADNYTNLNLNEFIKFHVNSKNNTLLSMVTFMTDDPQKCGIVKVNEKGVLIDFEEKPNNPKSNLANGAIYLFDQRFIKELEKLNPITDFSKDIIFKFKGRIQTWFTNDVLIDIGNPHSLDKARKIIFK